jgi:isoleucyl-tRNA synthetase
VSKLEVKTEGFGAIKGETMSIDVLPAEGIKCERCWRVVGHVHEEDGLCERCHAVVNEGSH